MQDWNYVHTNCFEITLELGCRKFPKAELLSGFWEANKYPLLVYIGQVGGADISRNMRNKSLVVSDHVQHSWPVQWQKKAGSLKFQRREEEEVLYYSMSVNKGTK